jgi:hypothetical protein
VIRAGRVRVFSGARGNLPGGTYTNLDRAERRIEEQRLTGTPTACPVDASRTRRAPSSSGDSLPPRGSTNTATAGSVRMEDERITMDPIKWVGSGGGPLVVVPFEVAHHWRGDEATWPPTGSLETIWETVRKDSDYGRACGLQDYLGLLDVGPGHGLVLGDEPMPTTFLPTGEGGLIARWMCAESEEDVLWAIRSVPEDVWETTSHRVHVGEGGLLLFDSAYPGDDLSGTCGDGANVPWLVVDLLQGAYEIDTSLYQPDDLTRLILHRLRRSDSEIG